MISRIVELRELPAEEVNTLFTQLIVPRPIGWVVTRSGSGRLDVAPFSSLAPVCNAPPLVSFASQREPGGEAKLTARNILETKEYLVHMLDESLIGRAVDTARRGEEFPHKLETSQVTTAKARIVSLPRIVECPIAIECRLHNHVLLGNNESGADLFIGEVLAVWVGSTFRPDRIVAALSVGEYLVNGRVVSIPNPPD